MAGRLYFNKVYSSAVNVNNSKTSAAKDHAYELLVQSQAFFLVFVVTIFPGSSFCTIVAYECISSLVSAGLASNEELSSTDIS